MNALIAVYAILRIGVLRYVRCSIVLRRLQRTMPAAVREQGGAMVDVTE